MLCSSPGLRLRANASSLRSARNVRIAKRQVGCASKVDDWNTTAQTLETASPLMIMDHALSTFGDDVAIAFSGAEDVALIELAHLTGRPYRVFSLDTGRLNPETYRFFEATEKHYNIRIEYTFPEAAEVMELVRAKGMFSFYEDGHKECCGIRKVKPLRKALTGLRAWITGQRKDQSPGTRTEVPTVQVDPVFEGIDGGAGSLIKYNPMTNMTSAEVWNLIRSLNVPYNELHNCGYVSIGCEPCTRPVIPNQDEREGRWYWEDSAQKECGLHSGNIKAASNEEEKKQEDLFTSSAVEHLDKDQLEALLEGPRDKDTIVVLYAPWCQFCKAMAESYETLAANMQSNPNLRVAKFQADIERDFAASKFGLKTFPHVAMLPKAGKAGEAIKYDTERRDVDSMTMFIKAMASGK